MFPPLLLVGVALLAAPLVTPSNVKASQAVKPDEINNGLRQSKSFWWESEDSPLKKSYDVFKRCANGGCGSAASFASADASLGPIQVDKNVFLSGSPSDSSGGIAAFHSGGSLGGNPFLKGQYVSVGQQHQQNGGCSDGGKVCVAKNLCQNGVLNSAAGHQDGNSKQCNQDAECNQQEACCRLPCKSSPFPNNINALIDFTPGKSSFPEKLAGNSENNQGGIQLNFIGQSGAPSPSSKPTRDLSGSNSGVFQFSSTPDYSNVNFDSSARFNSLFEGEDYLPPDTTSCPPGTFKTTSGRCEAVRKECPQGTRSTPSGGCEVIPTPPPQRPRCGPGQKEGPYGGCIDVTPRPTPPPQPQCGPQEILSPSGQCIAIPTPPPRPQCGPGQLLGPNGQCVYPTTPKPTCPPGTQQGPYGGCISITTSPRPTCPPGQKPGPYGGCIEIATSTPPTTARPTCPPGQRPGPYGGCIEIATSPPPTTARPTCPPGQKPGPYGGCIEIATLPPPTTARPTCPPGQRPGAYGGCIEIATPPPPSTARPTCPPGQRPGPYGGCIQIATSPPPTTARPTCPPGQKPGPYGGCVAIATQPPPTQKPTCPPGTQPGPYGGCISITSRPSPQPTTPGYEYPKPTCAPGERLGALGQCERIPRPTCAPGQQLGANGQCIYIQTTTQRPTCPPGQKPGPYGGCINIPPPTTPRPSCPIGQKPGPYGGCVDIPTPPPPTTPRATCPLGQKPGPYGVCVDIPTPPPPTTPGYEYPKPTCPPGQRLGPLGQCELIATRPPPTTARPTCPPGQKLGPYGGCIEIATRPPPTTTQRPTCPPGTQPGPYGSCVEIATRPPPTTARPTCPPGQKPGPYGGCIEIATRPPPQPTTSGYEYPKPTCPPGQRLGPLGQCELIATRPPPTTARPTCPPGQKRGPYGGCIDIATRPPPTTTQRPTCPPGTQPGPYGGCVEIATRPPPTTARPTCPPGQRPGPYGGCIEIATRPPTTTTQRPTCPPGTQPGPYGGCVEIATRPPPTTARPTCPPGQKPGPYGGCIEIATRPPPTTTQRPTCPPGTQQGPYGGCISITTPRPTCPPGSFPTAGGGCQRPTSTQRPPSTQKPCPPGYIQTPTGQCQPPPPPRPTCPSGTYLGASGNCERPQPPPTTTPGSGYLPPNRETPSPRPGYHYPIPTPSFEDGNTVDEADRNPDGSKTNIYVVTPPTKPTPRPTSRPTPPRPERPDVPSYESGSEIEETVIPVGCAAAMKCVQEIYCSPQGTISSTPVILSPEQKLFRVPTTACRDIESNSLGVCCRDSNYQDAWPSANLKNGIDDGQYAEDDSIGQYKDSYNRIERSSNSTRARRVVKRKVTKKLRGNLKRSKRATSVDECGVRNYNTNPTGERPIDANFAEITWQAMILRDTNRSLLCGGVIIRKNAVLTAAHCVQGLETSDVLIKGGEWKLGIDDEPLPFQIVKVDAIIRHPDWVPGSLVNDLVILHLEENLRFTKNVGKICLPQPNQIPTQNCISTGWGKRILQLHARGALMHKINVNIMDNNQCKDMLTQYFPNSVQNYSPNTLCGFSDIDACRVDYGSALACADETGRYMLSGIYGWDTGCRKQGQISGFVAPDVDWIDHVLEKPAKELKKLDREWRVQQSSS